MQILDTSAPGQIGTCVRHFSTKTNRHPDNSAPQLDKSSPQKRQIGSCVFFFDFLYMYKTSNSLEPILLHCIQLSSDIVKLKEVFLPHPFYHVSGLLLKMFSIWLAHALGSGMDSKNNNNPYTVIFFSLYV